MKKAIETYHKSGIIVQPDGVSLSYRKLIVNYLYHMLFYIEESERAITCIFNESYFQADLYGDDNKKSWIHYYRHHVCDLLNYMGMIKDGVRKINRIKVCKNILKFKFNKDARNLIVHIYPKMSILNSKTGLLHGFNVIFDNEDNYLKNIKEPVLNFDLATKKITMILIEKKAKTPILYDYDIDLYKIRKEINSIKLQVTRINEYINAAWYPSY